MDLLNYRDKLPNLTSYLEKLQILDYFERILIDDLLVLYDQKINPNSNLSDVKRWFFLMTDIAERFGVLDIIAEEDLEIDEVLYVQKNSFLRKFIMETTSPKLQILFVGHISVRNTIAIIIEWFDIPVDRLLNSIDYSCQSEFVLRKLELFSLAYEHYKIKKILFAECVAKKRIYSQLSDKYEEIMCKKSKGLNVITKQSSTSKDPIENIPQSSTSKDPIENITQPSTSKYSTEQITQPLNPAFRKKPIGLFINSLSQIELKKNVTWSEQQLDGQLNQRKINSKLTSDYNNLQQKLSDKLLFSSLSDYEKVAKQKSDDRRKLTTTPFSNYYVNLIKKELDEQQKSANAAHEKLLKQQPNIQSSLQQTKNTFKQQKIFQSSLNQFTQYYPKFDDLLKASAKKQFDERKSLLNQRKIEANKPNSLQKCVADFLGENNNEIDDIFGNLN